MMSDGIGCTSCVSVSHEQSKKMIVVKISVSRVALVPINPLGLLFTAPSPSLFHNNDGTLEPTLLSIAPMRPKHIVFTLRTEFNS